MAGPVCRYKLYPIQAMCLIYYIPTCIYISHITDHRLYLQALVLVRAQWGGTVGRIDRQYVTWCCA